MSLELIKLGILSILAAITTFYACSHKLGLSKGINLVTTLFTSYAVAQIALIVFLWFNHANFPLNLEAMELTRLEHLQRIVDGLPLYPEPSTDFIALAYNPLSYFLTVPFTWVFGVNLFSMRLVAILGMLGSGIVIYLAVYQGTKSRWWGLMAVGLFAAAYQVMDTYLDNAHADSWLILTILWGCYLVNQNRSQFRNIFGVLLVVTSFWLKQQGSLFIIGILLYLLWRDGWAKSWLAAILALVFAPGLYLLTPPQLFGSHFHYFTWSVPRQWVGINLQEIILLPQLIIKSYLPLATFSLIGFVWQIKNFHLKTSVWYFMLPIASGSAMMAVLTPGSNKNVFIPLGVWLIITGVIGLQQISQKYFSFEKLGLHLFILGLSFILFIYNPLEVIVSSKTKTTYQDFVSYLNSLDAPVYAPWIGQLQDSVQFYPSLHWVALSDLIRTPGTNLHNHSQIRELLEPVAKPPSKAYLLHNYGLEQDNLLNFLTESYVLDTDLGSRFQPLQTLPKRYNLLWPRYLYRYAPEEVISNN